MVCKLSELYFKESSLMAEKELISERANKSRLEHELAFLFGREILQGSYAMSQSEMFIQAEHIGEIVDRLQAQAGKPEAQRAIVKGVSDGTAMALCKWIGKTL